MKPNGRMDILVEQPADGTKESEATNPLEVELRIQTKDQTITIKCHRGEFSSLLAHPRRWAHSPKQLDIAIELNTENDVLTPKRAG